MFTALEFFAGSGLVREGLSPDFATLWANDNCPKKRETYVANHGMKEFHLGSIEDIKGAGLPAAHLAWASFPCQDLSLAGSLSGMTTGTRSGLFWEWVRVLRELKSAGKLPPILVAENVVGFLVSNRGEHFREACRAIRGLGFYVGTVVIDASIFVPQSRSRAFIVAVSKDVSIEGLTQEAPSGRFHPDHLVRAVFADDDPDWVWWSLRTPGKRRITFGDLCERDAPCDPQEKTLALCDMLAPLHKRRLDAARKLELFFAGTAYKRTRPDEDGNRVQRLELRFDGLAGCLRTPNGGSSRQTAVFVDGGKVRTRLLTPRECARLMGARDSYELRGTYNDRYRAMGDAVAVPVTRWLTQQLLAPLARRVDQPIAAQEAEIGKRGLCNDRLEQAPPSGGAIHV